jgi:multidrug efflux pump subunit AcrB
MILALLAGAWAYLVMPRAQYPEVGLNWVAVAVVWPAAPAQDVERFVTLPLEAAVRRVADVRYVSATSRDHVATLIVRFHDMAHGQFERRLQELNQEIQRAAAELPRETRPPQVVELTTSNVFHTAMLVVTGDVVDGQICDLAQVVQRDLEDMRDVGRVWVYGLRGREIRVAFDPEALQRHRVSPEALVRTLAEQTHDYPAGTVPMGGQEYSVRVQGLGANPDYFADLPVAVAVAGGGAVALSDLAQVSRGIAPARELVRLDGKPAILLTVTKKENANTLDLTERIHAYVATKNRQLGQNALVLADDQSESTRAAIGAMERNAMLGLLLVLLITWVFLGRRMALLISLGVPFALAVMFLALYLAGQTLNVSVLLGVAIVLGIPLDDAVVVAEAIQMRMEQGLSRLDAVRQGLREVAAPVSASVLATVAAFAPLLLLPGILGKFMFVVPLSVILTLLASLAASLWILPGHVVAWGGGRSPVSPARRRLRRYKRRMNTLYGRWLAAAFRHPGRVGLVLLAVFALVLGGLLLGWLQVRWFASDPLRVFNVNIQMPATQGLEATLEATRAAEKRIRALARPGEVRASLAMAGLQFTPSEPFVGEHLGQVTVSLAPEEHGARGVDAFVAAVRPALKDLPGVKDASFQVLSADLPTLSALTLRLSGEDRAQMAAAAGELHQALAKVPGIRDLRDDAELGKPQITLRLDSAAAARAGLDPMKLAALVRMHFEGLPVAKVADGDDVLDVVIRARPMSDEQVRAWLERDWLLPDGRVVKPGSLFTLHFEAAASQLRRVNHQRAVTVQADLDRTRLTSQAATEQARRLWEDIRQRYPGVELAFGGELEDVKESLDALAWLFLLGLLAMYLLLSAQFRSFVLPLLILATAPMAFAGVILGLLVSGQPLTLYTLYGGVALGGVSINASIVLVAAARDRLERGFPPLAAAFHAARRRLPPILITTVAILGGLVSLAFGLGGQSLLWGPLAAAIVWGLAFATPLTLFATPLLYYALARRGARQAAGA